MRRRIQYRGVQYALAVVAAILTLGAERGAVAQSEPSYEQTVEWLKGKLGHYHEVSTYYTDSDRDLSSYSYFYKMNFLEEPGAVRVVTKNRQDDFWYYDFFLQATEIKTDILNTSPRIIFECIEADCVRNVYEDEKLTERTLPFGVDCGDISTSKWRRDGPDYTFNADRCIHGKSDPKEVRYRDRIAKAFRHLQSLSPKDDLF